VRVTVALAMVGWLALQPTLGILEAQGVAEKSGAPQDSLTLMQDSLSVVRDPLALPVPFGPGERMEYQVKLGVFSAGEAYIAVDGLDTVRGHPTYRLSMGLNGGILFAKVNDTYQSWLDTRRLVSLRFVRDVHEVRYKAFREWMIFPEERRWELISADRAETMNTSEPLDELAFVFWLRTLPLKVGDTYTSDRYFLDDGNPVVIRVLRKERKEVPAGEFDTIVVQPTFQTKGLFGQGGKAEIFLTDDPSHHVVYLRSEIPVVGSVTLHLRSALLGTPLNPTSAVN
jgi:hypothetical protein